MEHFRSRALAITITLITYLLGFSGTVHAGILCFGEDGHVSLDSGSAFLSAAGVPFVNIHTAESEQAPGHCDEDCGACFDIPISTHQVQNLVQDNDGFHIGLMPLPAFASAAQQPCEQKITFTLSGSTSHGNTTASSLRSVVLLI